MFFTILTFCAALFIEGLGSLVSVIGISALFGANPIIIALAIALDVGKVVTVSLLYTYWRELSRIMKTYALLAATVTMVITSAGAAGYLSGEFTKAIQGTKEGELKVGVLKEQQAKYQDRKKQIDDQIAKLPEKTTVNQRLRLINGFKAEQKALDDKISAIDKELPDVQIKQIGTEAKAGPIVYIAKAFNITVERAVSFVIGLIIFVFDPLAIFLIIAGNFLWAHHRKPKNVAVGVEADPLIHRRPLPEGPLVDGFLFHKEDVPPEVQHHTEDKPPEVALQPLNAPFPGQDEPWTPEMISEFHAALEPYEDQEPEKIEPAKTEELKIVHEKSAEPKFVHEEWDDSMFKPSKEVIAALREHIPEHAPEPEIVDRPRHIQSGLLSPVNVEHESSELEPLEVHEVKPLENPIPIELPAAKSPPQRREEITRSMLGIVVPDPSTIVDARRTGSFTEPRSAVSPKR
jgi:hypothetical protein